MPKTLGFAHLVELMDALSLAEKETLLQVLRQRTIEERRRQLVADARDSCKELRQGRIKPVTPDELMREIRR